MNIGAYEARIVVPLRERDNQFMKIQELIEAKRELLLKKQKKLNFISKQNEFLEGIKEDYTRYYEYISQQKRDQIRALELLDEYIKDLTRSGKLTKHNIEDAVEEQQKIFNEVKSIKKGLDSIISNTQDLTMNKNYRY